MIADYFTEAKRESWEYCRRKAKAIVEKEADIPQVRREFKAAYVAARKEGHSHPDAVKAGSVAADTFVAELPKLVEAGA